MKTISDLLKVSGAALGGDMVNFVGINFERSPVFAREFNALLNRKNGFFAFESSLRVFPASAESSLSIEKWNSRTLWRYEYKEMAEGLIFFSEDAFGNQFCVKEDNIFFFDAETGDLKFLANSLSDWVTLVLEDYEYMTGYPLMHLWQSENGRLQEGMRLMPRMPFVLGGDYNTKNIIAIDAVSGMRTRENIAKQIKYLPDGAQIELRIID